MAATKSPSEARNLVDSKASSTRLIIANVSKGSEMEDNKTLRKKAIAGMLESEEPDIVLLQELVWKNIRDKQNSKKRYWEGINIPDKFEHIKYKGTSTKEASFVYDKTKLNVKIPNVIEIANCVEEMKKVGKLADKSSEEVIRRMCIGEVKTKGSSRKHFLCISWHGRWKITDQRKIRDVQYLIVLIKEISKQMGLPFIIGGDFNITYEQVIEKFENTDNTMHLYEYDAMERRKDRKIDFYISKNISLADITAIDWMTVKDGKAAREIFDHDPVIAHLRSSNSSQNETTCLSDTLKKSRTPSLQND